LGVVAAEEDRVVEIDEFEARLGGVGDDVAPLIKIFKRTGEKNSEGEKLPEPCSLGDTHQCREVG
jgi:hypothetical protein